MKVEFAEGEKLENPEKNPRSQIEIDKSQLLAELENRSWFLEMEGATDEQYADLTPLVHKCIMDV